MRPEAIAYLCCPTCRGDLELDGTPEALGQIDRGALRCLACRVDYPIDRGVPDFVGGAGEARVEQTTKGFARNWEAFNKTILAEPALNDELLRDWLYPLPLERFAGQVVCEPGCGMGRWLHVAHAYGPEALIGLDYSAVVHTAYANTRHLPHVHIVRGDILRMPLRPCIDLAYCIGVLHHLQDPGTAFSALTRVLAPDGLLTVWVYDQENNAWLTSVVTPLREKITSRLPHPILAGLSKVLTAQLFVAAALQSHLGARGDVFYADYLAYVRRYPFRYMEHIVYDHLVPSIAHYIPRSELEAWTQREGLAALVLARNNNSWRLHAARRPELLPALDDEVGSAG